MSTLVAFVTSTAGMSWLLACSLKAALLLAASATGAALLRRGSAAARHQIWALGVIGALVLPLLCWIVPGLSPSSHPLAIASSSFAGDAVTVTAHPARHAVWPMWLAIVWAAGAVVLALRIVRGHLAARRLARTAQTTVVASWTEALGEAAAAVGLARRVWLLRSETIGSPMTIGVVRPRVLLPAAAEAWSRERLRAVLVHELGHVRRRDTAIQLAAQVACALYWWNPLAWLAAARLRIEREHACDDLVLGTGIEASSYAADLLDVARSIAIDARASAGAICMVDESWIETRLRRILDTAPRQPVRARFRMAAVALTAGALALIACTSSPPVLPPPTAKAAPVATLSVGTGSVRGPQTFRPTTVQNGLDEARISAEVKRRSATLEHCYERRLAVAPTLAGTIVVHWTIAAETGEVLDQCITTDTVGDDELIECVNALVAEGSFPAPHGGSMDVSFPFVFAGAAVADVR